MRGVRRFPHRALPAAAVLVLVLLGACTSAEPSVPGPATAERASSPVTLEPEQDLVVAGRHFKAQCTGQGPSVLLVSGLGATMGDWGDLPTRLGATARTCMYDRLGIGDSDAPRAAAQTFEDIAADLDGVISALRLPRPVAVVAHSFGGPIAVTWAARHQSDARALVLLDTIPPGWHAALPSLMPPPDPSDPELSAMLEAIRHDNDVTQKSWTAYDRISHLDMPLRVIVAGVPPRLPAAVDAAKYTAAWNGGQRRLAGLSSDSHIVTAADADHIIWLWRLDLVLSTVADALTP